ncbi:MAG: UDP-N-acetylglucosamine 1-carboxyvinyltransferase, partial [Acidobacteriaceae bacterium]
MSKFLIKGGRYLSGEVAVSGSKNATLPLMAACLLTAEECELTNVSDIKDVASLSEILKGLGARVEFGNRTVKIKAQDLVSSEPDPALVGKLRGSILLLGSLLGRTGRVKVPFPGGDRIGKRPIDTHVAALKALGAEDLSDGSVEFSATKLKGAKIVLEETSVTATENALMAAVLAEGQTVIKLAAMEPHVQQLGEFLNLMGADITGLGTPTIVINGVAKLHGAQVQVIPDSEEASSLITLSAAAKGDVIISKLNPDYLEDYLLKLKKLNVNFETGPDFVHVKEPVSEYTGTKIQCGFYPKLNSDYIPPMSVLATQATGETLMYEWLYENRLGYVAELIKMGANAEILDPHRVKIIGPTKLKGQKITSFDLRMGMTLVIAALIAEG